MKTLSRLVLIGGLLTVGLRVPAQEAGEVEQLRKQLQEMKASFERAQQLQREQIEALQKQLDAVQRQQVAGGTSNLQPSTFNLQPFPKQGAAYLDVGLSGTFAAGGSTANDLNELQPGGHDPNQRGFTVQGVEAAFSGGIDPYFHGNASVLFGIDGEGKSYLELEEAWAETVSLPGNFTVRAGQYLTEFGRVNTQHPHAWSFVDAPLVNARFLGADGLRNPGVLVSWEMPTKFHSDLMLGVQNSQGETAAGFRSAGHHHGAEGAAEVPFGFRHADNDRGVRSVGDMLFTPRWASSVELAENQTMLAGVSGAFGPNSSGGAGDARTEIYGVDLTWKWKAAHNHGGFPFVSVQAEAMLRRYGLGAFDWSGEPAGEPVALESDGVTPAVLGRERLKDWGIYSQMLWGFRQGWVAGVRADYLTGDRANYESAGLIWQDADGNQSALGRDHAREERWRLSPNLTWYPSDFTKVRLQYNYDDRRDRGVDHSVWLQFEFMLGAHGGGHEEREEAGCEGHHH